MASELEKYRKEVFDKWWNTEIEPQIGGLSAEFRAKIEKHRVGFISDNVAHDGVDDLRLKSEPIAKLQKEFDDLLEIGKGFLRIIVKFYLNAGKP